MSNKDGLIGQALKTLLRYPFWLFSAMHHDPTQAISEQIRKNPRLYLPLCGYRVSGVSDVVIDDLSMQALPDHATARVRATPEPSPGIPAGPSCDGHIRFRYSIFTSGSWADKEQQYRVGILGGTVLSRESEIPAAVPADVRYLALDLGNTPMPMAEGQEVWGVLGELSPRADDGMPMDEYSISLKAGIPYTLSGGLLYGAMMHPSSSIRVQVFHSGKSIHDEGYSTRYLTAWTVLKVEENAVYTIRVSYQGEPEYQGAYQLSLRAPVQGVSRQRDDRGSAD
jgi:hypothetical protein